MTKSNVTLYNFSLLISSTMEEESFRFLTKSNDGNLGFSNENLSIYGEKLLYCAVHNMLKKGNISQKEHNKKTMNTYEVLSNMSDVPLERNKVLNILSNFIDDNGSLINRKKKRQISQINDRLIENPNKKIKKEDEFLTYVKGQCGIHKNVDMAKILSLTKSTLQSKIDTYRRKGGKFDFTNNDKANCEFCIRQECKEADFKVNSIDISTPKRKVEKNRKRLDVFQPEEKSTGQISPFKSNNSRISETPKRKIEEVETTPTNTVSNTKKDDKTFLTPKRKINTDENSPLNNAERSNDFITPKRPISKENPFKKLCLSESEKNEALNDKHNKSTDSINSDQPKSTPDCKENLSSTQVITEEMMNFVQSNCQEHSYAEMAQVFGVKPGTLRKSIIKKKIVYTNFDKDPKKCLFCEGTTKSKLSYSTKSRRMNIVVNSIQRLARQEKKSDEAMISDISSKMFYQQKRKLAEIYKKLGENDENKALLEDFKFSVPNKVAIQFKIKLRLSKSKYNSLRTTLEDYIRLPCYDTLMAEAKFMLPTKEDPLDFKLQGEVVGSYWPALKVAQDAVVDILEVFHGHDPKRVPPELWMLGGFGGDGFGQCNDRMGKDKDKNTASRYVAGMRISRIRGPKDPNSSDPPTEYFVETSQSGASIKPILIAEVKENKETLDLIWKWLQETWKYALKEFTVIFRGEEIKVHFEKPKFIGDGKAYLQLLNLPRAYCFLCSMSCEQGNDIHLCEHGMHIDRNIEDLWNHVEKLMKRWQKDKKTKKSFQDYFSAEMRKFMCGYPTFIVGGFDFENLPTMHFKIHLFDFLKKLAYQMNSRLYTTDFRSVAEIEKEMGKSKVKKAEKQEQKCKKCKKVCKGFLSLKSHIKNKSNVKCFDYYDQFKLFDKVLANAKHEVAFFRKTRKQTLLQSYLAKAKKKYTKDIEEALHIKVNMCKISGQGGSVENGGTTMKYLEIANREKVLDLYYTNHPIHLHEREQLNSLLDQALVIIGVTNSIGQINVEDFGAYVKSALCDWIKNFGKFVHIKSSLHWTMSHVAELITKNDGYTLADYTENTFENWIKSYRFTTDNQARQFGIKENNIDCLNTLYLASRQDVRRNDLVKPKKKKNDRISVKINSFFIKKEEGKRWKFHLD